MSTDPRVSSFDLPLPQWTLAAAHAARWLHRSAPWSTPIDGDATKGSLSDEWESWRLGPGQAPHAAAHVGTDALLQFHLDSTWGESRWLLHAPTLPWLHMLATEDDEGSLPPEAALSRWAAEAWWQPVSLWLQQRGLPDQRLRSLSLWPAARRPPSQGWMQLRQADEPVVDLLCLQWPALAPPPPHAWQGLPPWAAMRSCSAAWAALPLAGQVQLGSRALPMSLWQTLMPGDVLLLHHPLQPEPVPCQLNWGAAPGPVLSVQVRVDEHQLILQGTPVMTASTAPEAIAELPQDLQIQVHFELDTLPLPLAELTQLRSGSVLPLSVPLTQATVRLVACGQVVGHAQLVAVGDQLGARIHTLGPHHAG